MQLSAHDRSNRFSAWALVPAALVITVLAVPYLIARGWLVVAIPLQHGFALVCHQRPERSFWIFGAPVAVCARCLGIYCGAALCCLLRISRQVAFRLLLVAAAINALDAATELAGLHGNWLRVRFVLGVGLGAAAAAMIAASVRESQPPAEINASFAAPAQMPR